MLKWIKRLVAVGVLGIVAAIIAPLFMRARGSDGHGSSCQRNLKQIGLGFAQYIQDYNEKYPPVRSGSGAQASGWINSLQPYVKSSQIYGCPKDNNWNIGSDAHSRGYTSFWMNANASGLNQSAIPATALLILSGDGNDGSDQSDAGYNLTSLPPSWIVDENSPAYRHKDGANYAFADGHAKWLEPNRISANAGGRNLSFALH